MSERPYARVYHEVMSDPKFDGIREDSRLFGAWTLCLVVADMAYPSPAFVPPTVPRSSFRRLVECGLIDELAGHRFRIHGLEAERSRRSESARVGGLASGRSRAVERPLNDGSRTPRTESNLAEQRQDETSKAEQMERSPDMPSSEDRDALDVYHELTLYRPWGIWSGDKLRGAIRDYTNAAVEAALRTEHAADPDRNSLMDRAMARLAKDAEGQRRAAATKPRPKPTPDDAAYQAARRLLIKGTDAA